MEFTKPNSLNGAQLKAELKAQGINVEVIDDLGNGKIEFAIGVSEKTKAESIVAAHVGVDTVPTIAEKLASVGLSIADLKAALA